MKNVKGGNFHEKGYYYRKCRHHSGYGCYHCEVQKERLIYARTGIGVDEKTAEQDAEKIEYAVCQKSFIALETVFKK